MTLPSGWIGSRVPSRACVGIDQRVERLVLHDDGFQRAPRRLGMIGRDRGDGLADVAHVVLREHGLILRDEPVGERSGHVFGREHGLDTTNLPRRRRVDANDARVRMR